MNLPVAPAAIAGFGVTYEGLKPCNAAAVNDAPLKFWSYL